MAVTRIKNNQITDSTITYQKIASGTLVGSVFNANLNLNSNVTITGNLQVTGNTTTVNSIDTTVNDPLIVFNSGYVGTPSYDVGFLVDRSLGALGNYGAVNAALVWSESDGAFITVLTSETGATKGTITRNFRANLITGNLTVSNTATIETARISVLQSSGIFTASGNIVAASGTVSSSFTTGAIVVPGGGGVGITGKLYVQGESSFQGNINAGNIVLAGNINVPVGGTFSNTGVFYGNAGGVGALYAGTSVYTALPTTVLQMSGNVNSYAQVNFQNYNSGSKASTDFVATADNGSDTDGYINMGINSSTFSDANYPALGPTDGYLIHHGVGGTGNLFIVNHTGNVSVNGIAFQVGDFSVANVQAAIFTGGMTIYANNDSTSTTTGSFTVAGGIGAKGNIHAAAINQTPIGNTNPSTGRFTSLFATNTSSPNVVISGGYISALTNAYVTTGRIENFSTGNAQITGGYAIGLSNIATTGIATVEGNLLAASSAASISTTTGALVVVGGAGIGGNVNIGEDLYVTGNLNVQGTTTTLNTNTLDVEDINITLAKGAPNASAADNGGITLEGANATILYKSTGDSWTFNKQIIAPTLNVTANVFLKPKTGAATVAIDPTLIGTIDNMTIGATSAANAYVTNQRVSTSLNVTATGPVWISGGTGTSGIQNIPVGSVTPSTGVFTQTNAVALYTTTLNSTTANITTLAVTTGLSTANAVISGGYISALSNATITTGNVGSLYTTTLNATNANITGAIYAGSLNTANAVISGGYISTVANITVTDIITAATANITTLVTPGTTTVGGNIVGNSGTTSSNVATGALVLTGSGGAGIGGNVFVGQAVDINSSKSVHDSYIRGKNENTLLWAVADTVYDQVVIGGNLTVANVTQGAKLVVKSNDALLVPVGSSAQRPGNQGFSDVEGMLRFNSTTNILEYYGGGEWNNTGSAFTVIEQRTFANASGDTGGNVNGSNQTFTLNSNSSTNGTLVSINGVLQIPTTAYTVTGSTLTFTEAPAPGDVIDTRILTTTSVVDQLASENGFNQFVANNTSLSFYTGNIALGSIENWRIDARGDFYPVTASNIGAPSNRVEYLFASNINLSGGTISGVTLTGGPIDDTPIGGNVGNTGNFTTLTANVFQANTSVTIIAGLMTIDNTANTTIVGGTTGIIDNFDKTVHRSGKFFVQVSNEGTGEYQATEVICVHNDTVATIATYGVTFTGAANLATFSANISANDVNLLATPIGNVNIKTFATLMKI